MRILNETEKVTSCSKCDSEIAYYDYEVQREMLPPCCEEVCWYYIVCPKCKKKIYLPRGSEGHS